LLQNVAPYTSSGHPKNEKKMKKKGKKNKIKRADTPPMNYCEEEEAASREPAAPYHKLFPPLL
jgi:hypothetical protein